MIIVEDPLHLEDSGEWHGSVSGDSNNVVKSDHAEEIKKSVQLPDFMFHNKTGKKVTFTFFNEINNGSEDQTHDDRLFYKDQFDNFVTEDKKTCNDYKAMLADHVKEVMQGYT